MADKIEIKDVIKTGSLPFSNFLPTKAITSNYTVDPSTDYGLIVAATVADIIITLPPLADLTDKPYQVLEIIPVVANGFKVRIATQGADTFPFGNTWFDLPFSQKHFSIGLHPHGFNLRRNISIGMTVHRAAVWASTNFVTPIGIPWDVLVKNNQSELLEHDLGINPERIYVRTKGSYIISGGLNADPQTVQDWQVIASIYVNGIEIPYMKMTIGGSGNNNESLYASSPIDLEEDDYIEMRLTHSGSAIIDVTSAQFSVEIRL